MKKLQISSLCMHARAKLVCHLKQTRCKIQGAELEVVVSGDTSVLSSERAFMFKG